MEPLIHTLTKMADIFGTFQIETNVSEEDIVKAKVPKLLHLAYTGMEESWLKYQLKRLQDQYLSVGIPNDYLQGVLFMMKTGRRAPRFVVKAIIIIINSSKYSRAVFINK